ncbi:MAG: hypothetical protein OHK0022_48970 [Roseiflexaceae bacterium]
MTHPKTVIERFHPRPLPFWRRLRTGGGALALSGDGLRLWLPGARRQIYADAQIDDYSGLPRRSYPWRPPLRMRVRARASGPLLGTAGFGFWNNPLAPLGGWPALPAALWFFHASPPSDMPLALGVPGRGWKVAAIDTTTPEAFACAPLALPVALANNIPALERRIWPPIQRALRISEAPITPLAGTWREHTLEWYLDGARFLLDGVVVHECERVPAGPLGFVAWLDNQWAIVTPRGRFGWGLLDTPEQWLELGEIVIET